MLFGVCVVMCCVWDGVLYDVCVLCIVFGDGV